MLAALTLGGTRTRTRLYSELRRIAAIHLSRSAKSPSLQAKQLVHVALIRFAGQGWKSRTHFLALASRAMRMILVDAIRARNTGKRGGEREHIEIVPGLEPVNPSAALSPEQVLDVDRALDKLAVA